MTNISLLKVAGKMIFPILWGYVTSQEGKQTNLAKWNNISPLPRFPWKEFPSKKLPFGGKSVVWGRYNLTRLHEKLLFHHFHPFQNDSLGFHSMEFIRHGYKIKVPPLGRFCSSLRRGVCQPTFLDPLLVFRHKGTSIQWIFQVPVKGGIGSI